MSPPRRRTPGAEIDLGEELVRAREEIARLRAEVERLAGADVEAFVRALPLGWKLQAGRYPMFRDGEPEGELLAWMLLDEHDRLIGYSTCTSAEALAQLGGIPALLRARAAEGARL